MSEKRQLLFVQGGGKGAHDEWDSQLVASLERALGQGYEIRYPRMPHESDPKYERWESALDAELGALRDDAIVVAHSLGATVLLKLLSEQPARRSFGAIFLIAAPFVGEGGWAADELQLPPKLGARLPKGVPIDFYQGLADQIAPPAHVELYARAVPQARVHRLSGRDHQLNGDLSEVASAILSLDK
jgi:predicted alpha/beta hydrolase family esterase